MGRLIRIAIYAIVILALYYWTVTMTKGCYQPTNNQHVVKVEDTTMVDTVDTVLDSIVETNEVPISNEDIVDGNINYKEVDKTIETLKENRPVENPEVVAPKPKTSTALPNKTSTTSETNAKPKIAPTPTPKTVQKDVKETKPIANTSSTAGEIGNYMVMAGSYLLKANAEKMVKKLKSKGYNNAKVVIFNASEYHSVIAATYATDAKAQSAVNQLKKAGIDSFVKSK